MKKTRRRFLISPIISLCVCMSLMVLFPRVSIAVTVPASEIGAAVERVVREYAVLCGLDFEITVPHVRDVEIKGCATPEIRAVMTSKKIRRTTAPVRVEFRGVDGSIIRRIHLIADLKIFAVAAVAAHDIARGDSIREEDVTLRRVVVNTVRGYFSNPKEIVGTRANQSLKKGSIFRSQTVSPELLVRRGDRVTMKAVVGSVELISEGVARQDGGKGEYIRVYNSGTRVSVVCRIVDEHTVLVGKEGG